MSINLGNVGIQWSRVRQLRIPIPISPSRPPYYAIAWSSVGPRVTLYCKRFGLTVGEDVYDLRLPSVSRIPDIHVMVWISCHHPSLVFSDITCIYSCVSLFCVLRFASSQLSVALHHPHSPPCIFPLYLCCNPVVLNSEVPAHAGAV